MNEAAADQIFLSDDETRYIFDKLKSRYGLRQTLRVRGRLQYGACGDWVIRLPHNPSIGLTAHEIAHAILLKKPRRKGQHYHTKRHGNITSRVAAVISSHLDEWRNHLKQRVLADQARFQRKIKREEEGKAYRNSPEGKLEHLRKLEKKATTRLKRAETHLKKIQRRIKLMERRVQRAKQTLSEIQLQANRQDERLEKRETKIQRV
jgi:hypothetical protein